MSKISKITVELTLGNNISEIIDTLESVKRHYPTAELFDFEDDSELVFAVVNADIKDIKDEWFIRGYKRDSRR